MKVIMRRSQIFKFEAARYGVRLSEIRAIGHGENK
jgi:hypothetical protein